MKPPIFVNSVPVSANFEQLWINVISGSKLTRNVILIAKDLNKLNVNV